MTNTDLILKKAARKLLQLIFRFDRWHVSPVEERPYAQDVVKYCNSRVRRNRFVEIGCGLGDITRAVDYKKKIGLDMDANVLKAASWLSRKNKINTYFQVFHFPDSPLGRDIDTLVMVNWIHHVHPDLLRQKIAEYFEQHLNNGGCLVVDTVQDPAYKYNHDIAFLTTGLNCAVERLGNYARQRELWAIKKTG